MPTSRPRHTITETEELAQALDDAAGQWPEERGSRTRLLRRLVLEGHRAIVDGRGEQAKHRREAVRRTGGALTGAYGSDYLKRLRDDWPA
jgi:hypothetical protein